MAKARTARPPGPKRRRGKVHFLNSLVLRDAWCRGGYSRREDELTRERPLVTCRSCEKALARAGR